MRNIEHNMDSAVPGLRDRWAFAAVGVVVLLAIAASLQFATWLDGPGSPEARRLDTGWFYLRDGVSEPIDSLPCTLDVEGESLVLCRDLTRAGSTPWGACGTLSPCLPVPRPTG